jgi:PAS domain S-box-containing protein
MVSDSMVLQRVAIPRPEDDPMHFLLSDQARFVDQAKRSAWRRYGLAILAVVLALVLTLWIPPIQRGAPFMFFFLAVLISSLYGGLGPGLLSISMAGLLSFYWVIPLGGVPWVTREQGILFGFLLVSSLMTWLIHARQRAFDIVALQRESFRTTLTSIGDAVIATDRAGRITLLNEVASRLTGWSAQAALGQPLEKVFHIVNEQSRTPVENPVHRVLAEGAVVGLANHTLLIAKDGTEWAIADSAAPIRDETGVTTGAVLVFRDISENRRIETALREREAQLRLITDHLPALISLVDTEERYRFANAEYKVWFGQSADQLVGRRVQDLLDTFSYANVRPYLQRAFQGETVTFENKYYLRNGSTKIGNVTYVPQPGPDGQVQGVYVLVVDITERKESELRTRFLADASKFFATSLDPAATLQRLVDLLVVDFADWGMIDLVDQTGTMYLAAIAHCDPTKTAWARARWEQFPPPKTTAQGAYQVLRTGRSALYPGLSDEILRTVAGDEAHLAVFQRIGCRSALLVPLPIRGQTVGVLTLVRSKNNQRYSEADLRFAEEVAQRAALSLDNARLYQEARQAEARLKQFNQRLEERVQERTAELARSNAELDEFAHVASHDLKAPLRAIVHLANWISEDAGRLLPPQSREHLAKLHGRILRMETLLDDLLAYSRAGRYRHSPEVVDVKTLVQEVVEFVDCPAGFTVTVAEPLPVLVTERVPLETVFRNVIGNAFKHHHQAAQGMVTIRAIERGEFVEFIVTDNGPGIAPEYHERIFGIFQTLRPRDEVEGSGIGLTVVKKLVESRGGWIRVESAEGQGATFRFTWSRDTH